MAYAETYIDLSEYRKDITWEDEGFYYLPLSGNTQEPTVQNLISTRAAGQYVDFVTGAEILMVLKRLEGKHDTHDETTLKTLEELHSNLAKLTSENEHFRKELSLANPPTKLRRYSTAALFFSIFSLFVGNTISEYLIHPILSYIVLFASVGFIVMSQIMIKQDSRNKE
jgi:hypothetical protein